jgi:regulatory protein
MQIIEIKKDIGKDLSQIIFDDESCLNISADTISVFSLKIGSDISVELYQDILEYNTSKKILNETAKLLSKKSFSAKDLFNKLIKKGYSDKSSSIAIEKMKELGYINDERYSLNLSESLIEKNKSLNFIRAKLESHNIDKEIISKVLSGICNNQNEQILKLIRKKFKNLDINDEKSFDRVAAFLERNGFESDDIEKVLNCIKRGF